MREFTFFSIIMMGLVGFLVGIVFFDVLAEETLIPSSIKERVKDYERNGFDDFELYSIVQSFQKGGLLEGQLNLKISNSYEIPRRGGFSYLQFQGNTGKYGYSGAVNHLIIQPDNSTLQIQSFVLETGVFVLTFPITFDSLVGKYHVYSNFQGEDLQSFSFFLSEPTNQEYQHKIPPWVKINTEWWLNEKISDKEFLLMIQYLINENIISLPSIEKDTNFHSDIGSQFPTGQLKVEITGEKFVRRGTMQSLMVKVMDEFSLPIKGAKIVLTVEDYGEDVIFNFDGKSNEVGQYLFSWEIPKRFNDIETLIAFIDVTDGLSSITKRFVFQVYCQPGEKNCEVEGN